MAARAWVAVSGAVASVVVVIAVGASLSYVELGSDSMEPWAQSGALVVHRPTPAAAVEVGDVVTVDAPDRGLVTHRVVGLTGTADGAVAARLKGDSNRTPDAVPVELVDEVPVAIARIPVLGRALRVAGPMTGAALALLALGGVALWTSAGDGPGEGAHVPSVPSDGGEALDPRIEALLATCEEFAEDGLAPVVLDDLVRVRTAAALGLASIEDDAGWAGLDDGARFYVVALADADPDALALVAPDSRRRVQGSAVVARWWDRTAPAVPVTVRALVDDMVA